MPALVSLSDTLKYLSTGGAGLGIVPSWFIHALAEIGQAEVHGAGSNLRIAQYWKGADIDVAVTDDETPWCAAFVGAMIASALIYGTRKANAKSYLGWGDNLPNNAEPPVGAIVVLNRPPADWKGHVAFCAGWANGKVHLLGGNQGDRVSIAAFDQKRIAGIRWPKEVPLIGTRILLPVTANSPTTG